MDWLRYGNRTVPMKAPEAAIWLHYLSEEVRKIKKPARWLENAITIWSAIAHQDTGTINAHFDDILSSPDRLEIVKKALERAIAEVAKLPDPIPAQWLNEMKFLGGRGRIVWKDISREWLLKYGYGIQRLLDGIEGGDPKVEFNPQHPSILKWRQWEFEKLGAQSTDEYLEHVAKRLSR